MAMKLGLFLIICLSFFVILRSETGEGVDIYTSNVVW
jgi:hypothetical protein